MLVPNTFSSHSQPRRRLLDQLENPTSAHGWPRPQASQRLTATLTARASPTARTWCLGPQAYTGGVESGAWACPERAPASASATSSASRVPHGIGTRYRPFPPFTPG